MASTTGNPVANFFKKLLHVVEAPFTYAKKIGQILEGVEKGLVDAPEAKTLVVGLVQQFEAISPDAVAAIAGDGANFAAEEKTVGDIVNLFNYFKNTFVPGVEQIYADVKADLTGTSGTVAAVAAATPAPAPAAAVAHTGAAE